MAERIFKVEQNFVLQYRMPEFNSDPDPRLQDDCNQYALESLLWIIVGAAFQGQNCGFVAETATGGNLMASITNVSCKTCDPVLGSP